LTWRAKISIGVPLGLLFIGIIVALDVWLANRLLNEHIRPQQISFLTFLMALVVLVSVPVLLVLIYQTIGCLTLRYRLDRNGVLICWGGSTRIIPIRDIQRVIPGEPLGSTVVRRRGIRWPGHERGDGAVPGIGRTVFLATRPLGHQLLLITPGEAVGISPHDPEGFLDAYEKRRELGPNRLLERGVRQASWLTWSLWTDQTARVLIGAAVLINLGLFGYLCARFPGLDLQLPLHFNSLGQADRIGLRIELFALPIIGLIILGTNLFLGLILYKGERAGSYLLWGAAAAAGALFWLAAFSIVP
jgi:hypothetical protein